MQIEFQLNGRPFSRDVRPDAMLMTVLREAGCASVKCGCETTNCGLCTVFVDDRPMLSCAYPAPRAQGKHIVTLEGLQDIAADFGAFLADQGADQCGFCNPGFVMNVIAMRRAFGLEAGSPLPSDDDIRDFLAGNLCRCTGYAGQTRAIRRYLTERVGCVASPDAPDAADTADMSDAPDTDGEVSRG